MLCLGGTFEFTMKRMSISNACTYISGHVVLGGIIGWLETKMSQIEPRPKLNPSGGIESLFSFRLQSQQTILGNLFPVQL